MEPDFGAESGGGERRRVAAAPGHAERRGVGGVAARRVVPGRRVAPGAGSLTLYSSIYIRAFAPSIFIIFI